MISKERIIVFFVIYLFCPAQSQFLLPVPTPNLPSPTPHPFLLLSLQKRAGFPCISLDHAYQVAVRLTSPLLRRLDETTQ